MDRLNIVTEQKDFYISLQNNDLFISQIRKFKRESAKLICDLVNGKQHKNKQVVLNVSLRKGKTTIV